MRNASKISRDFWDYTTLDPKLLDDAARLTEKDIEQMGRPGFIVKLYDSLEAFFNAEALEYVWTWKQSTKSRRESAVPSARRSNSPLSRRS